MPLSKQLSKVSRRKFDLGGFALGLFLGAPGILIAYLMKGDETKMKNRKRWAIIGGVINLILSIILLILFLNAFGNMFGDMFVNMFSGII